MEVDLWLDESGNFKEDYKQKDRPSLVGGVMLKANTISEQEARNLLLEAQQDVPSLKDSTTIHATEMNNHEFQVFAPKLLKLLREADMQFVIFENEELMKVVNGDLTYIHILAEGIIQLFQALALQTNEKIKINIYAAKRVDVAKSEEEKYTIMIKEKEYLERLQEKLDLGYARRNIRPHEQKWEWEFKLGSARDDTRLMLADVVCHSWYRIDSRKFKHEDREWVKDLYNLQYRFTALERSTIASIQRHFSYGTIGDALYEWLLMGDEWQDSTEHQGLHTQKEQELLHIIIQRLAELPSSAREIQLNILLSHLKTLILLDRKYNKGRSLLFMIRDEVMPQMEQVGLIDDNFFFEIHLMLFTNATHQGDLILSEEQAKHCRTYLQQLAGRWENYNILLDFYIREAVHLMNSYDYEKVIHSMTQVESLIKSMIELFPIALQEELALETEKMDADVLGKALGTRLQAYTMNARVERTYLDFAREDSDRAMTHFFHESDLQRQYQYRSMLECEANEFTTSLQWLAKSVGIEEVTNIENLLQTVLKGRFSSNIYFFMHYVRLMAQAKLTNDDKLADELYDAWTKLKIEDLFIKNIKKQHPDEIIFWKLATYLINNGNIKAAQERYKQAIEICEYNEHSQTMLSIGLAIRAEEVYFLSLAGKKHGQATKQALRRLLNAYQHFSELPLLPSIRNYFGAWDELIKPDVEKDKNYYEKLYELSRTVCF